MEMSALLHHIALHTHAAPAAKAVIARTIAKFGQGLVRFIFSQDIRVYALAPGESFCAASPFTARAIPHDDWPFPPAGLFVVTERTVYLRTLTPLAIAHEFGHALDCAIGGGRYFSESSSVVQNAFAHAERFVTPYAAVGIDEYFAENIRAFVGINDRSSPWPRVSRAKLQRYDPPMHALIADIFAEPRHMLPAAPNAAVSDDALTRAFL